jgi:hypothetical protein
MKIANSSLMVIAGAALLVGLPAFAEKVAPLLSAEGAGPTASPIFGVTLPSAYRSWQLISVSYEEPFDEFRGIVGNVIAVNAYLSGTLPFPDGAILVKIAWKRAPSPEFKGAFIASTASTVQVMVKDSVRYEPTGGWGFGRFKDGYAANESEHRTCFACHQANVLGHDFVFTRWAP